MTQKDRIKALLDTGEWICTNNFYRDYMADPRTILSRMRKAGVKMEWRWCENPDHHHQGNSKEWRLTAQPDPEIERIEREFAEAEMKMAQAKLL